MGKKISNCGGENDAGGRELQRARRRELQRARNPLS